MDYHLVLQFPVKSEEEAEQLALLEDDFIDYLEDTADLDGHEVEGQVLNHFITTSDPEDTFERLRPLLEEKRLLGKVIVAYRHVDEDEYTLLWPEDDPEAERRFKAPD
jgi:hypothetical protein